MVNKSEDTELMKILRVYGEVDAPHKVARTIILNRPINTSGELMDALLPFTQKGKEHKFYAQVFQALRIEVNEELEVLQTFLQQSSEVLKPGGRLSVISYHSLEDRLVKDYMKTGNFEGEPEKDFFGNLLRPLAPLKSKPIIPAEQEIQENTRARSAKLRVATKL